MGKKESVSNRRYTEEFKTEAVRLALSTGGNAALQTAYWRRKPAPGMIMHSDRGSQYASDRHRKLIADCRMVQSMSRKANRWDNAPAESFFKTLKVERLYQLDAKPAPKLDSTSLIGSRASTFIGACIRRSGIGPRHTWNPASWLRSLVYVKSRQGQYVAAPRHVREPSSTATMPAEWPAARHRARA